MKHASKRSNLAWSASTAPSCTVLHPSTSSPAGLDHSPKHSKHSHFHSGVGQPNVHFCGDGFRNLGMISDGCRRRGCKNPLETLLRGFSRLLGVPSLASVCPKTTTCLPHWRREHRLQYARKLTIGCSMVGGAVYQKLEPLLVSRSRIRLQPRGFPMSWRVTVDQVRVKGYFFTSCFIDGFIYLYSAAVQHTSSLLCTIPEESRADLWK